MNKKRTYQSVLVLFFLAFFLTGSQAQDKLKRGPTQAFLMRTNMILKQVSKAVPDKVIKLPEIKEVKKIEPVKIISLSLAEKYQKIATNDLASGDLLSALYYSNEAREIAFELAKKYKFEKPDNWWWTPHELSLLEFLKKKKVPIKELEEMEKVKK